MLFLMGVGLEYQKQEHFKIFNTTSKIIGKAGRKHSKCFNFGERPKLKLTHEVHSQYLQSKTLIINLLNIFSPHAKCQ